MSDRSTLHKRLIHLAHSNPGPLQDALLPLLRGASQKTAIRLPNEGKDNSWGRGYFPLPPALHHLGRYADIFKAPLDHKVFPDEGTHMITVAVTPRFSILREDLRMLGRLGLSRIQSNQNAQLSFYFTGYLVDELLGEED